MNAPALAPHRPIEPRFVPATRIGLIAGVVIGLASGLSVRAFHDDEARPADPVSQAVATVVAPAPAEVDVAAAAVIPAPGKLVGPAVVNVWLQNCRDCMPAFAAWKDLVERGATRDMRIVNVAYGGTRDAFAGAWHVDQNIVADNDGALVVQPFGISSFTTLVVDASGAVLLRARPGEPRFGERLAAAWAAAERSQQP